MREPKVPPKAEKIMINPDIGECRFLGKALKTVEFNNGYMGAINKPINGKTKPNTGTSAILSICARLFTSTFNWGNTYKRIPPEMMIQTMTRKTHDILLVK